MSDNFQHKSDARELNHPVALIFNLLSSLSGLSKVRMHFIKLCCEFTQLRLLQSSVAFRDLEWWREHESRGHVHASQPAKSPE